MKEISILIGGKAGFGIDKAGAIIGSLLNELGRGTSHGLELLKKIFREAILHKGFALIDVLQVCVTYFNMYEYYDKRVYELKDHEPNDYRLAFDKIREWDYNRDDTPIALGLLYRKEMPTFEDRLFFSKPSPVTIDREAKMRNFFLEEAV